MNQNPALESSSSNSPNRSLLRRLSEASSRLRITAGMPIPAGAQMILFAIATTVVTLSCMTIPRVPFVVHDADFSWNAVLNYAHEKKLQFGQDIVFTYGP